MHGNGHGVHKPSHGVRINGALSAELPEQFVDDAGFNPTPETLVNRMPFAVLFRQPPPFAAVFTYVQYGIDKAYILDRYVTALDR